MIMQNILILLKKLFEHFQCEYTIETTKNIGFKHENWVSLFKKYKKHKESGENGLVFQKFVTENY